MYKTKKDVDKYVENLSNKLSSKEFQTRANSIARLYFDVGDYSNCQRYVEQYLSQKDNNAAAHRLLGHALYKLGQKERALEQFKTSFDIDPTQTSLILDICEVLADNEVVIDTARAKYWCEKAESTFPRHPVTFLLCEKLISVTNPDPEAVVKLLKKELSLRPKDALLHARLLRQYIETNKIKEAFDYSFNIEFGDKPFVNNFAWYETVAEILNCNSHNCSDWQYHLLLLNVKERLCVLSLSEIPSGTSKSLVESNKFLHEYDQAINSVATAGACPGFGEFHVCLVNHHKGQLALHAATFVLKKAKRDQLSWRDAAKVAAPLMLSAWQTVPLDIKVNWLSNVPETQRNAVKCWYKEGAYRCSQSGHYIIANAQNRSQSFLDKISQSCSGAHWKEKLYEKLFTRDQLTKIKSSYLASNSFESPTLRLPRKVEVEAYDSDAQNEYANSLHHFVWTLLNYKNFAHMKCLLFNMLSPKTQNIANCGPETLNKLDIHAFMYATALTTQRRLSNQSSYMTSTEKPIILPANITDLLCCVSQMKWWDCAYKFVQNELGTELTDIRVTLSRGIEVVRCIDNHGLDPELLCNLGRIFKEQSKYVTSVEEKSHLEMRAELYYTSAIPLLEKFKNKIIVKYPERRMFDYSQKELNSKELNLLLEESKIYVAVTYIENGEYEKVIEILSNLKSPQAYYHLSETYKKMAFEEKNFSRDAFDIDHKSVYASLLSKAKNYAYRMLDLLKDSGTNKDHHLYSEAQQQIEELETHLNRIDTNVSINNGERRYSSDENTSLVGTDPVPMHINVLRNLSSTPKQPCTLNTTNYRTAIDSHVLESTKVGQKSLERIENQIKDLQKRDSVINDFMEQMKVRFEENQNLGTKIINTIDNNIQNTTDQFKLLKISVDQVKDRIDECRNDCKELGELKKQIAELKREVNKLKKPSSEQTIDESQLYNMDGDYRTNDNASNFATQIPFTPPQVIPPFNQRFAAPFPIPPNPYQMYSQNFYNLYNQYSQLTQPSSAAGASSLFDGNRPPFNYTGMYPTPDQMYLDVAHLVPPPVQPSVPIVPSVSTPAMPSTPKIAVSTSAVPSSLSKFNSVKDSKESSRSLPINVVITSSDPLPTYTSTQGPILSVTIPPKHIKSTAHNYQIPMPSTNDTNMVQPPLFSFPTSGNTTLNTTASPLTNWNKSSVFDDTSFRNTSVLEDKHEKNVVDGAYDVSPNISHNKSRTLSEKSNTSTENYDPCPDFKPIIPLPAEVKVTTGEEDETVIFKSRAKLFRFIDKQWKERGIGEMKLLKHKETGKVRVLMRREQIHKICANHIITSGTEIKPMKNETKTYFWVANDFAEETVILEKFCIRFKTTEIAQQFYECFEKARKDSLHTSNSESEVKPKLNYKIDSSNTPTNTKTEQNVNPEKTVMGGFTFSSTPNFKSIPENTKIVSDAKETTTTKLNVFSTLTFKSNNTSPFSNLFTTAGQSSTHTDSNIKKLENKPDDVVDDFEPTAEFKPVVPLPALIDHKTGEEDEIVLFEHRAKLLRFEGLSKEWKERGLGNIKLLVHTSNDQKLRLLMRREQVMKVCCNHSVTKDMIFQRMQNVDKAVTWCAQDYSEGELVPETFCLRFKTATACTDFIEAIKLAQSKIKEDTKSSKEVQNVAKQSNKFGFDDKFKPKTGSWNCETCYTNNLENFAKCACCEQPKPSIKNQVSASISNAWGDTFKPKPNSWECENCLVRNDANVVSCTACKNSKAINLSTKDVKLTTDSTFKIAGIAAPFGGTSALPNWGGEFKPKAGTWECTQCFVRNESNIQNCVACNSPRDGNTSVQENNSLFKNVESATKFKFGITSSINDNSKLKTEASSIFDGTGGHKFRFGIPTSDNKAPNKVLSFGEPKAVKPVDVPGSAKVSYTEGSPLNFSLKLNECNTTTTPMKPALLPTPQKENSSFSGKDGGSFDFVFKPKAQIKGKSPVKSPKSEKGDESDNEYASDDEGHHIHFNPVIPLPDKVEVVTGEENEDEIYGHRAKLFRFTAGEWKERGIGIVKILKHHETGKFRVVMRREQVLKICLNHALTPDIMYSSKDEKTWLFAANDFSEGELSLQQFCLRFKNKEIAMEFKNAIDSVRSGNIVNNNSAFETKANKDNDDVIFVEEIQATDEEKKKAKELMLPENFFTYKNKQPCEGCRGCYDSIDAPFSKTIASLKVPILSESTPTKNATLTFFSPSNSIYGTPANFNRTTDTVFGTPLNTSQNLFTKTSNIENDSPTTTKVSILAAPKLTTRQIESSEQNCANSKSVFGFAQVKETKESINKGLSVNKSIFDLPEHKSSPQNLEGKTVIVADPNKKTFNLFSGTNASIFGSDVANQGSSIFGSKQANPPMLGLFGSALAQQNTGLFGSTQKNTSTIIFGFDQSTTVSNNETQSKYPWSSNNIEKKEVTLNDLVKEEKSEDKGDKDKKESLFNVDSSLSFAALSSSVPGFDVQKKQDFKWEGAGQQIFGVGSKSKDKNNSKNESGAGEEVEEEAGSGAGGDEEYDPHYEPIVPLPDKIVVTTGEEDEKKVFGERCKLYRYDEQAREWKERGVGEMKILYHPEKNSYRLLLRREQVHKAVLNMLLFMDLELLPMKNSDRAWTWAGRNYAETIAGEQETLAVRFKTVALAACFKDKVTECVRKLQAAAAQSIRESEEEKTEVKASGGVHQLRLPKHLTSAARADEAIVASAHCSQPQLPVGTPAGTAPAQSPAETFKQVHFQQPEETDNTDNDDEYKHEYDHNEDYENYYNEDEEDEEEEDESSVYYACVGSAFVQQGGSQTKCDEAQIEVMYDQEIYSPKILVTDLNTGEILADMLIHTETDFQLSGNSCTWTGTDYTSNDPVDKTVTIDFHYSETAINFFHSCETSKGATYSGTDTDH